MIENGVHNRTIKLCIKYEGEGGGEEENGVLVLNQCGKSNCGSGGEWEPRAMNWRAGTKAVAFTTRPQFLSENSHK